MNEKSNFYVFEKKEVFLIVLFVVLVAITSFLFGLKLGSSYSFDKSGNTGSDYQEISTKGPSVEFKSTEEEKVEEIVESRAGDRKDINKEIEKSLKQKLVNEFTNENEKFTNPAETKTQVNEAPKEQVAPAVAPVPQVESTEAKDDFSGKYTIQLGAFPSLSEAKEFSEGFKVLGYSPIINEAEIPGKGNQFKVSLGVFANILEAKQYVIKHKSLFAERDYFFYKFD